MFFKSITKQNLIQSLRKTACISSATFPLQVGLCLGSKLDSLSLPGSSITEATLLTLLPRLTSLRRLDLRGLDSLFMSGAFLSKEEHRQQVVQCICLTISNLKLKPHNKKKYFFYKKKVKHSKRKWYEV